MEELIAQLTGALCVGGGFAMTVLIGISIVRQFLIIGEPNEVLIFSGRQRALADGSMVGSSEVIGGGRRFRVPVVEKVDRMSLNTLPIDIQVQNAYSKGGIPLNVHAVANVKISSDQRVVRNAIERFLGRDQAEIRRVAKETLEGHLRGVLATLTPEEVNEDRLKFAGALVDEAEEDFVKLGLTLDTLKVQNVSDEVQYLDSIGRKRIAEVIRDAEVAETTAVSNAERAEAESRQVGDVAMENANAIVVQAENSLRQRRAELDATARSEEEKAAAAAQEARANAEAELQVIRRELEKLRLMADVVLPAQAEKEAAELRARGKAASIEETGKAQAAVLQMLTDTWKVAGDDAKDIFLLQQLDEVMKTVVRRIHSLDIDDVTLIDSGDGQALPRHVASFPAMVNQVLGELKHTTGVDVTGILTGKEVK